MSDEFAALEAEVDAPSRMIILHPETDRPLVDKDGKEAYIDFLSPDSEVARKIDRVKNRAMRQQMMKGRNAVIEDVIDEQVEKLTAVAVGWYLLDLAGNPIDVPFSKDAARRFFSNPKLGWLRRQSWVHHNGEANFIKSSSKDS